MIAGGEKWWLAHRHAAVGKRWVGTLLKDDDVGLLVEAACASSCRCPACNAPNNDELLCSGHCPFFSLALLPLLVAFRATRVVSRRVFPLVFCWNACSFACSRCALFSAQCRCAPLFFCLPLLSRVVAINTVLYGPCYSITPFLSSSLSMRVALSYFLVDSGGRTAGPRLFVVSHSANSET